MNITTREELINALVAAAELEHGLMVQYLYATMTLKGQNDGLTPEQLTKVQRWSARIRGVERQEMGHLATVLNLLEAVGGGSHLNRMRLPSATGLYTPPVPFVLQPLTPDTIERFIMFEMPENPPPSPRALAPEPVVIEHVGQLYGDIKAGIEAFDEAKLFVGRITGQDQTLWSFDVTVAPVTDRATAAAAIDTIIVEGEGSAAGTADSHWGRLTQIRRELLEEIQTEPGFTAHRDVVSNPATLPPPVLVNPDTTLVTEPDTKSTAELFNAAYTTLLLILVKYYRFDETPEKQNALQGMAKALMMNVIAKLGPLLSQLPAGNGKNAGPPFEIYTLPSLPDDRDSSLTVIRERFDIMSSFATDLGTRVTKDGIVSRVAQQLNAIKGIIPA